jgi:hypothetical protein
MLDRPEKPLHRTGEATGVPVELAREVRVGQGLLPEVFARGKPQQPLRVSLNGGEPVWR